MTVKEKIKKLLYSWPWVTAVAPVWAIACILNNTVMLIFTDSYLSIPAFQVKFDVAPWWVWVIAYLAISIWVLVGRNSLSAVLQCGLTLTEGMAVFFASFTPGVSPTAGVTFLAIGVSLAVGMIRANFISDRDYESKYGSRRRDHEHK